MLDANFADADSGYLILIADDIPEARYFKKFVLEDDGYSTIEAGDGCEAIEAAMREHPRLILMNCLMPVMDGLEAATIIKETPVLQQIPIIMTSLYQESEMKTRAFEAGCVDYIEEPCECDELLNKVRMHILVG
jgi:CheY-like chemotaxis protein